MANVALVMECALNTIESIIGNGEQCRIEAFSPFPTMFLKAFFIEAFKNRDYEVV